MFGTLLLLLHAALFSFSPILLLLDYFHFIYLFFLLHLTGALYSRRLFFPPLYLALLASDRSPICCAWLNVTKCENNRWHCSGIQRKPIRNNATLFTQCPAALRILFRSFAGCVEKCCVCVCLCLSKFYCIGWCSFFYSTVTLHTHQNPQNGINQSEKKWLQFFIAPSLCPFLSFGSIHCFFSFLPLF